MTSPNSLTKTEIAKQYIEKYIEIALKNKSQFSKRFIATVMQAENSERFKDVEDARTFIRMATDTAGRKAKTPEKAELNKFFALIPAEIRDTTTTEPFIIPVSIKKTLWISDIHGRFYDRKALQIAIDYGIKSNCDSVVINGDFLDFYGDSKFDKNPSLVYLFEEQEWGQEVLQMLQKLFGYVVLKQGNHDVRRELHIQRLSATKPELMDMAKYSDYLFYDGCTVHFVEDYRHIVYGKLNAIHGHEYYGGGGIHVAHNRLHKAFDNVISGHSHVAQSKIKTSISGEVYGSWALGCLCDLHPRYASKNEWVHGFAITEKEPDGSFGVENKAIFNGKIFSV